MRGKTRLSEPPGPFNQLTKAAVVVAEEGKDLEAHLLRHIMSADEENADGGGCGALVFGLDDFLTTADDDDAPRVGDGCDFSEGDDWPLDLLSSSTEEDFLFLAMAIPLVPGWQWML